MAACVLQLLAAAGLPVAEILGSGYFVDTRLVFIPVFTWAVGVPVAATGLIGLARLLPAFLAFHVLASPVAGAAVAILTAVVHLNVLAKCGQSHSQFAGCDAATCACVASSSCTTATLRGGDPGCSACAAWGTDVCAAAGSRLGASIPWAGGGLLILVAALSSAASLPALMRLAAHIYGSGASSGDARALQDAEELVDAYVQAASTEVEETGTSAGPGHLKSYRQEQQGVAGGGLDSAPSSLVEEFAPGKGGGAGSGAASGHRLDAAATPPTPPGADDDPAYGNQPRQRANLVPWAFVRAVRRSLVLLELHAADVAADSSSQMPEAVLKRARRLMVARGDEALAELSQVEAFTAFAASGASYNFFFDSKGIPSSRGSGSGSGGSGVGRARGRCFTAAGPPPRQQQYQRYSMLRQATTLSPNETIDPFYGCPVLPQEQAAMKASTHSGVEDGQSVRPRGGSSLMASNHKSRRLDSSSYRQHHQPDSYSLAEAGNELPSSMTHTLIGNKAAANAVAGGAAVPQHSNSTAQWLMTGSWSQERDENAYAVDASVRVTVSPSLRPSQQHAASAARGGRNSSLVSMPSPASVDQPRLSAAALPGRTSSNQESLLLPVPANTTAVAASAAPAAADSADDYVSQRPRWL